MTFLHPAEFVDAGEGILAVSGAQWFAALLLRVPGLEIRMTAKKVGASCFLLDAIARSSGWLELLG